MLDLVIVGAGPAGITAAVYAARKKMDFVLLTKDIGGQTALSSDVENYTGYQFITGAELVAKFEEHLKQFDVKLKSDETVKEIRKLEGAGYRVEGTSETYEAKTVLVATGRSPRWLDVPGEAAFRNKGVSYCATCDGPLFSGKTVVVIGGGNSAMDAVLQMVKIASKVYLVNINAALGGDEVMRQKVQSYKNVEILNQALTKEIKGDAFVKALVVEQGGQQKQISVEGIFVEIGSVPNSGVIDFVKKNDAAEIVIDHLNQTDQAGIFAAGDVTDIPEKQIIVAAGEGAKAVLGIFRYLNGLH